GDGRGVEVRGDGGLAEEALGGRGVGGEAVLQELDRHLPVQGELAGTPDHAHAAAADLIEQLEARHRGNGRDRDRGIAVRRRGVGGGSGGGSAGGGRARGGAGLVVVRHGGAPQGAWH